jgi:hypothetical protein
MALGALNRIQTPPSQDEKPVKGYEKIQRSYGHSKYNAARQTTDPFGAGHNTSEAQAGEPTGTPAFLNTDPMTPSVSGYPSSHAMPIGVFEGNQDVELVRGISEHMVRQSTILQQILSAIRMTQPTMQAFIWGNDKQLNANIPTDFKFVVGSHPVPALKLVVQNNTASTVFMGLGSGASPAGLQLAAGAIFDSIVNINYLSLLCAATVQLSGPNGVFNTAAVLVQAWTNPEWVRSWGQL